MVLVELKKSLRNFAYLPYFLKKCAKFWRFYFVRTHISHLAVH